MNTNKKLTNHFKLSEWSGATGDLGTTLPLAFALIVFNGFPVERIFLLWGMVYIITGLFYKVPVSVQPLKAMAVIAISLGYSIDFIATTALFYGILFILLSWTGIIRWLQNWFSPTLVRGIQLGIGLILAQKAIQIVIGKGVWLNFESPYPYINISLMIGIIMVLWLFQFRKRFPIVLIFILGGIGISKTMGISLDTHIFQGKPLKLTLPEFPSFVSGLIYLIIPQLPLTLGNAVYAASDTCHTFWKTRAQRVSPTRLGLSIGFSNVVIGLLGGFPICHGAGGIGAHAQFGGKTGGTTVIIGTVFVICALVSPLSTFLFFIPVPILGAMLLFDSWRMVRLVQTLETKFNLVIAMVVGIISFATRNLSLALIVGFVLEQAHSYLQKRFEILMKRSEE